MRKRNRLGLLALTISLFGTSGAFAHDYHKGHGNVASAECQHEQRAQGRSGVLKLNSSDSEYLRPIRWMANLKARANATRVPSNNTLGLTGKGYRKWLTLALQQGRDTLTNICWQYKGWLADKHAQGQKETDYLDAAVGFWDHHGRRDQQCEGKSLRFIGERYILMSAIQFLVDRGVSGMDGDPDQPACDECLENFSLFYCRTNPKPPKAPFCLPNEP